jgi:hypothetical protein
MTENQTETPATERLAKRSTVNHILNCFCCYKSSSKAKNGTLVPHLATGLESSGDSEDCWEVRFDEAVNNLASVVAERKKPVVAPGTSEHNS